MTDSLFGLFPGQGSQKVGMGKKLFDEHKEAKECFEEANEILGFSLSKLCFEGPEQELTLTKNAQPAILTASIASFRVWCKNGGDIKNITVAAGHSLGEYSALVASQAITLSDAVKATYQRGLFMQEAVPQGVGGMIAVLGSETEVIEEIISQVHEGVVEIANLNAPGQIVVAGDTKGLSLFSEKLGKIKSIPLSVSAPFHCSLMKPASEKLKLILDKISFATPIFPVISNVTSQPHKDTSHMTQLLCEQVTSRVRWTESVLYGLNEFKVDKVIEFGEGGILTGLMKRISSETPRMSYP